ncbi:YiiX/YebB-like N1pC/P60 family cysteine hydrolase [Aestuariirhabdus sp. LZHN29]|uniref:YiiX/YebB-like N1pC/P60 family cysteine hydrolase n=1 Tax=Aestuariirhabdus sp. LZHN29 TaxID=3417462 RepID=UPI003CED4265
MDNNRTRTPSWAYRVKSAALTFLGHVRFYRYPFFLVFRIPGYKFRDLYQLLDRVQPGDLLLRKYDSYLNTFFIPGYYTHAGICFDQRSIVHAIAGGVEKIDTPYFCRCDHLILLRHKGISAMTQAAREKAVADLQERLLGALGAPFDFDVASGDDRFYCSELAAYAYRGLSEFSPRVHKLWGWMPTPRGIAPQDFIDHPDFEIIYRSSHD